MAKDVKDDVFGCEIVVNGSTYYLTPLTKSQSASSADFIRGFRLEKQDPKRPGVYDVIQTHHGFECDCRDYMIRRAGQDSLGCKHLRAMFFFGFLREGGAPAGAPAGTDPGPALAHVSTQRVPGVILLREEVLL